VADMVTRFDNTKGIARRVNLPNRCVLRRVMSCMKASPRLPNLI
jgi:hypothetical protein